MGSDRDRRKRAEKAARAKQQHAKNRKVNLLQPAMGSLPHNHVMDAIADAIHQGVTGVFDELEEAGKIPPAKTAGAKIKGRCLYYAAAGQYVAEEFLGREYWVQVGSLGVNTDEEHMIKIDAANGGVNARRFHMWLAGDDGGIIETVDFTSRYFKEWAAEVNAEWKREDLPDYLWGIRAIIAEQHGVQYQQEIAEEPAADAIISANQKIIDSIVERAKQIARKLLGLEAST